MLVFSRVCLSILVVTVLTNCGGGRGEATLSDSSPPPSAASAPQETLYGGIPSSAFNAVSPPTVDLFVLAYETVTTANPEASSDNSQLAQRVFDYIKANSSKPNETTPAEHLLTRDEFRLSMLQVKTSYLAYTAVSIAEESAKASFPCGVSEDYVDDKADAFRHAYWNALMTSRVGQQIAFLIGVAHETDTPSSPSSAMDLHNNRVGQILASANPTASDEVLRALLETQPMWRVKSTDIITAPAHVLVYLQGSQAYDGTMKGSLSSSAGTTDPVTFEFSQCDISLRGTMTQTHGSAVYRRRFRGSLSQDGTATLTVDAPYPFENPEGDSQCIGMTMRLTGGAERLTGSWSSSNCGADGSLSISR